MELPKRPKGDEFTSVGEYPALRRRLRDVASRLDIPTVVSYAFDKRTRILPYIFTSHRMAPSGARAVAAALHDSGLTNVRIVLQQWTPNFRPSRAKLDGKPIEMFLVSSMQIHAECAYGLVADACSIDPDRRPLILAGGPKAIYEPWDLFGIGGDPNVSADVVVTGEEFVLMQLVEVLLEYRAQDGTMLEAFRRARSDGTLNGIPGLIFRENDAPHSRLVNTGIQRMVRDLDEMPHPVIGYKLLERPHWGRTLKLNPLAENKVRYHSFISSLTMTHGCKFNCDYCPIPAYNQRTYRHKSGDRLVDEMRRLREELGLGLFFGTDDNFFNDRDSVAEMFQKMSRAKINGRPFHKSVRWGTEATEFDTWKNRDLLPAGRKSGLRALWFGIEDLTATLIKKGQSVNKTAELFDMLNTVGICPMPMMMHHDGQPLYSREGMYGLLNQVKFLRQSGAQSLQVTVLTPAVGTRSYEDTFNKGWVFDSVGGKPVLQHQFDGNHAVASESKKPWRTQLNVLAAYAYYYNPLNFVRNLIRPKNRLAMAGAYDQLRGMIGLVKTAATSSVWALRLARGPIVRKLAPPGPVEPMLDLSQPDAQEPVAPSPLAATPQRREFIQVGTVPRNADTVTA